MKKLENLINEFFTKKGLTPAVISISRGDQFTPFFVYLNWDAYVYLTPIGMDFNLFNTELMCHGYGQVEMGSKLCVIGIKRYSPVRL